MAQHADLLVEQGAPRVRPPAHNDAGWRQGTQQSDLLVEQSLSRLSPPVHNDAGWRQGTQEATVQQQRNLQRGPYARRAMYAQRMAKNMGTKRRNPPSQ